MFDLKELASQFETKTQLLCAARQHLYDCAEYVFDYTERLANAKIDAMNSGRVDGKNDEARKAQIADICQSEIADLRQAEARERAARFGLEQAQSNLDLTRYLLRIAELAARE